MKFFEGFEIITWGKPFLWLGFHYGKCKFIESGYVLYYVQLAFWEFRKWVKTSPNDYE